MMSEGTKEKQVIEKYLRCPSCTSNLIARFAAEPDGSTTVECKFCGSEIWEIIFYDSVEEMTNSRTKFTEQLPDCW